MTEDDPFLGAKTFTFRRKRRAFPFNVQPNHSFPLCSCLCFPNDSLSITFPFLLLSQVSTAGGPKRRRRRTSGLEVKTFSVQTEAGTQEQVTKQTGKHSRSRHTWRRGRHTRAGVEVTTIYGRTWGTKKNTENQDTRNTRDTEIISPTQSKNTKSSKISV